MKMKLNRSYHLYFACVVILFFSLCSVLPQDRVAEGSSGNTLRLNVQNESSTFPLPGVIVKVEEHPDWVSFSSSEKSLNDIAPSSSGNADFTFGVDGNTKGRSGKIRLKVTATSGEEWTYLDNSLLEVFIIVGDEGAAICYILDRSGSMQGGPIVNAKNAANIGVSSMKIGDEVAVVSFAESATTNMSRTVIANDAVRQQAQNAINSLSAVGATSIGAGLQNGYEELIRSSFTTRNYVLLSDGDENTAPWVRDVLPLFSNLGPNKIMLNSQQVKHSIHTIAFGAGANQEQMSFIANETNGIYLHTETQNDPLELMNVFTTIQNEISGTQTITSFDSSITSPEVHVDVFTIGSTIDEETITLIWDQPDDILYLELEQPDGTVLTSDNWQNFQNVNQVSGPAIQYYTIDEPQNGAWIARVIANLTSGSANYALVYTTQSKLKMNIAFDQPEYFQRDPVNIQATVINENAPVAGAIVFAEITTPSSGEIEVLKRRYEHKRLAKTFPEDFPKKIRGQLFGKQEKNSPALFMELFDDGQHGDGNLNDGVYGNYFWDSDDIGSYGFSISAKGMLPDGEEFSRQSSRSIFIQQGPDYDVNPRQLDIQVEKGESVTESISLNNLSNFITDFQIVSRQANPLSVATRGPDKYGYRWKSSDDFNGPEFNWIDISEIGDAISLGDEETRIEILPFGFPFYENIQSQIKISSNGLLFFGDIVDSLHLNLPTPGRTIPNNLIAPFWTNLDPGSGGSLYKYHDSEQDRYIIQYSDIVYKGSDNTNTFQIILYSSGKIVYQYLKIDKSIEKMSIGLENGDGSMGLRVAYNDFFVHNNMTIVIDIAPHSNWLTTSDTAISLSPGAGAVIDLSIKTQDLNIGRNLSNLVLISNDQVRPVMTIPVNVTVYDELEKSAFFFPNPFNPQEDVGTIKYILKEPGNVTIRLYDVSVRLTRTLIVNEQKNAFEEQIEAWNGYNDKGKMVANGVYFYVIESSSGERSVGKIAVLR